MTAPSSSVQVAPTASLSGSKASLAAAAALWLPTLVPFLVGPLTECDHCVLVYRTVMVVLPGFLPGALLGGQNLGLGFWLVAALVTAGALGLLFGLARVTGRWWWLPLGVAAVLGSFHALGVSHGLRA